MKRRRRDGCVMNNWAKKKTDLRMAAAGSAAVCLHFAGLYIFTMAFTVC